MECLDQWLLSFCLTAPLDFSSSSVGLTINILDEKIPQSYDLLRLRIEDIARQLREQRRPPVLTRDDFWCVYVCVCVCV